MHQDPRGQADGWFPNLLDAVPDALIVVDTAAKVQLINAQFEILFGYRREELVGGQLALVLPTEVAGRRKNGTRFPIDVTTIGVETPHGAMRVTAVRDATERRQAEELLFRFQEEERSRLAAEIHDNPIQTITAASLRLQQLRRNLIESTQLETFAGVEEMLELTTGGLRKLMFELHPPALDGSGIREAIREHLEQLQARTGTVFRLEYRSAMEPALERRAPLYRIALQALSHLSPARKIVVEIDDRDDGYLLRITADGGLTSPNKKTPSDAGLRLLREMVRITGGWVKVPGTREDGTQLEIWIPAHPTGAASDPGLREVA